MTSVHLFSGEPVEQRTEATEQVTHKTDRIFIRF